MQQFNVISPQEVKTEVLKMMDNLAIGALNSLICDRYLKRNKSENDQGYILTVEVCDLITKMREMFSIIAFTDDEIQKAIQYHQIVDAYKEVGWFAWCESGIRFKFQECNTADSAT